MNFDEIVVKESPGLCRCCLSEGCYKDLGTEYIWMNDTEVYADMLLDCFDIGITQHMDGPNGAKRLICEVCITRLRDACNFKKQVLDSEKRFIDMLGRGEFRPKVLIYQQSKHLKAENIEEPSEELELPEDAEYLDDLEYMGDEEVIKTEVLQSTSNPTTSERPRVSKPKRGRPRKEEDKPTKETKLVKKPKVSKDCTPDQSATAERWRQNLKSLFNHTTIIPFKWKSKFTCFYCTEMFTEYAKFRKHTISHGPCTRKILQALRTHREIKIDVSEIVCELCQTEFKSLNVVVDHLIKSHSQEYDKSVEIQFQEYRLCDLRCVVCDKQFGKFKVLADHVHRSHSDRFECNDCGLLFNKTSLIASHIKMHHVASTFACELCGKEFADEPLLKRHDCREYFHQCAQCDSQFKYASALKKHVSKDHGNDVPDKRSKRNSLCHQIRRNIQCVLNMSTAIPFKFKGNFCCFYCSNWFTDFDDLILHTRAEHPICELKSKAMQTCKGEKSCVKLDVNGLACKICHETMSNLNCFVDHAIAEHRADYEKSIPLKVCFEAFCVTQGRIPCPQCQEPFAYFATLLKHLGAEHNHHKAVCAYCGRGFRTTTSLTIHISNSHTGMCECSICNAKCKNSAALARHMARYHDAKDFKCPQCPEQFETIYKKQNHLIKAHNVGHKCAYCGKMFTRNSFMMNHVRRTHLKERTVPCSVCHVKFFDSYHMKLHMVKHDGMRKFRCEVCGKSFLRVRNLKSHMDTHKKGYLNQVF